VETSILFQGDGLGGIKVLHMSPERSLPVHWKIQLVTLGSHY